MDDAPSPPRHFALMAGAFEGSLAIVAVGLGWLLAIDPLETLTWDMAAVGIGVTAALPLLLGLWLCMKFPLRPFRRLMKIFDEVLLPLFARCNVLEMAVIAALAGLGEELLFRGIVQGGLASKIGEPAGLWIGWIVAAGLFGALHALTATYALLAALIGLYLGGLWLLTGNLLVPVLGHAVYDFVALVYLVQLRRQA
jgi:membrane protease YdiL (CAAX protease family)